MSDLPIISTEQTENAVQTEMSLAEWIFGRIRPYVGGWVLEIACGEGLVAPVCERNGIEAEVKRIDLADEKFEEKHEMFMEKYDTLIVLGAGEQIKNDRHIVSNCTYLLKQGGYLITRLPAQTALFNGLNQGFKHWKYSNLEYINKLLRKDCRILKTRYFLVDHDPPASIIPMSRYSERVALFRESNATGMQTGLSMIIVGQKR